MATALEYLKGLLRNVIGFMATILGLLKETPSSYADALQNKRTEIEEALKGLKERLGDHHPEKEKLLQGLKESIAEFHREKLPNLYQVLLNKTKELGGLQGPKETTSQFLQEKLPWLIVLWKAVVDFLVQKLEALLPPGTSSDTVRIWVQLVIPLLLFLSLLILQYFLYGCFVLAWNTTIACAKAAYWAIGMITACARATYWEAIEIIKSCARAAYWAIEMIMACAIAAYWAIEMMMACAIAAYWAAIEIIKSCARAAYWAIEMIMACARAAYWAAIEIIKSCARAAYWAIEMIMACARAAYWAAIEIIKSCARAAYWATIEIIKACARVAWGTTKGGSSKMMKAPGRAGLHIARAVFESDPGSYFRALHANAPWQGAMPNFKSKWFIIGVGVVTAGVGLLKLL